MVGYLFACCSCLASLVFDWVCLLLGLLCVLLRVGLIMVVSWFADLMLANLLVWMVSGVGLPWYSYFKLVTFV